MNEKNEAVHYASLFHLSLKNIRQWKWRYVVIAVFMMLSIVVITMFRSSMLIAQQERSMRLAPLETPFFSFMVTLEEGDTLLADADYFTLMNDYVNNFRQFDYRAKMDTAHAVNVHSTYGFLTLLGLQPGSFFYADTISGTLPTQNQHIMLPTEISSTYKVQLGDNITVQTLVRNRYITYTYTVVGLYNGQGPTAFPIITTDSALMLSATNWPNRMLLDVDPSVQLFEAMGSYLSNRYLGHAILSSLSPAQLSTGFFSSDSLYGLLGLIMVFLSIGILTVGLMTFLERRSEYASLKSIGLTNTQIIVLFANEYLLSALCGLLVGSVALVVLVNGLHLFSALSSTQMLRIWVENLLLSGLVCFIALLFPARTAQIATVNQLLFARKIPLWNSKTDRYDLPAGEANAALVQNGGYHLLRVPQTDGKLDCLLFKQEGDIVRQGETIAVMESLAGFRFQEWCSPCDGTVERIDINGLITIVETAQ